MRSFSKEHFIALGFNGSVYIFCGTQNALGLNGSVYTYFEAE
jgi:hypothetical protein